MLCCDWFSRKTVPQYFATAKNRSSDQVHQLGPPYWLAPGRCQRIFINIHGQYVIQKNIYTSIRGLVPSLFVSLSVCLSVCVCVCSMLFCCLSLTVYAYEETFRCKISAISAQPFSLFRSLREYQTKQMPPFTFGELKNTTGTNLYDVDEDYPAGPEVQQPLPEWSNWHGSDDNQSVWMCGVVGVGNTRRIISVRRRYINVV